MKVPIPGGTVRQNVALQEKKRSLDHIIPGNNWEIFDEIINES